MGSRVGGLWVFENDNQRSAAYASLTIDTSHPRSAFSEFPYPEGTPDYPSHRQVAEYFQAYATHFELERFIRFRSEVVQVKPVQGDSPVLRVMVRDLSSGQITESLYDAVIVANGHHFAPSLPPGHPLPTFSGEAFHSHSYRNPKAPIDCRGKRVCVVGIGNSAVDIASELTEHASEVTLSVRRGAWVLPKYLFGKPLDQGGAISPWLPAWLRRRLSTFAIRWLVGNMKDFGLPKPDHRVGEAHPTVSDKLLPLLRAGKIRVRGPIEAAEGRKVSFGPLPGLSDSAEPLLEDVIVYCTGYRIAFPFFADDFISAHGNRLPLFGRVFHPDAPRVFFLGLAQTLGAIFPTVERQANWLAEYLSGTYNLPESELMRRAIETDEAARGARYVRSPRHTMQLDPEAFSSFLRRELEAGRKRAQAGVGVPFGKSDRTPPSAQTNPEPSSRLG